MTSPVEHIKKLILLNKNELENSLERCKILLETVETFLTLVENPVSKIEDNETEDVPFFENQIYLNEIDFEEQTTTEIASNENADSTN